LPTQALIQKTNIYWNYQLEEGKNTIKMMASDVPEGYRVNIYSALIYTQERNKSAIKTN